jgi:hypothetical protein
MMLVMSLPASPPGFHGPPHFFWKEDRTNDKFFCIFLRNLLKMSLLVRIEKMSHLVRIHLFVILPLWLLFLYYQKVDYPKIRVAILKEISLNLKKTIRVGKLIATCSFIEMNELLPVIWEFIGSRWWHTAFWLGSSQLSSYPITVRALGLLDQVKVFVPSPYEPVGESAPPIAQVSPVPTRENQSS